MSGYLSAQLSILCLNIIIAYAIFLPAASGQLNLGAGGFAIIGGYIGGWLNSSYDGLGMIMPLSVPLAALFTAAIAFLLSFPILRTRGVYMVLATFAFAEVVAGIVLNLEVVGGAAGFPVDSHADLGVLAPVTCGVVVFSWYLLNTRFGLAMRSVHDDENVATLFGINVRRVRVAAFTLGGLLGGLYGALYGHQYNYIEVQNWNVLFSIYVLLYVLLGGTQTPFGPLLGALFFTVVPELLRSLGESLNSELIADGRFAIFGALIVLMMVFRPEGIVTRTLLERVSGRRTAEPN
ncbi:branched-chain amino acid ABC transporter permease [Chromatiales bacterium (ex Bugula neritina AB1)]|nr:branched-chain amino acid ABC transporter permease [Chromatiales bacterium (ex Bugula neritina AB1)]